MSSNDTSDAPSGAPPVQRALPALPAHMAALMAQQLDVGPKRRRGADGAGSASDNPAERKRAKTAEGAPDLTAALDALLDGRVEAVEHEQIDELRELLAPSPAGAALAEAAHIHKLFDMPENYAAALAPARAARAELVRLLGGPALVAGRRARDALVEQLALPRPTVSGPERAALVTFANRALSRLVQDDGVRTAVRDFLKGKPSSPDRRAAARAALLAAPDDVLRAVGVPSARARRRAQLADPAQRAAARLLLRSAIDDQSLDMATPDEHFRLAQMYAHQLLRSSPAFERVSANLRALGRGLRRTSVAEVGAALALLAADADLLRQAIAADARDGGEAEQRQAEDDVRSQLIGDNDDPPTGGGASDAGSSADGGTGEAGGEAGEPADGGAQDMNTDESADDAPTGAPPVSPDRAMADLEIFQRRQITDANMDLMRQWYRYFNAVLFQNYLPDDMPLVIGDGLKKIQAKAYYTQKIQNIRIGGVLQPKLVDQIVFTRPWMFFEHTIHEHVNVLVHEMCHAMAQHIWTRVRTPTQFAELVRAGLLPSDLKFDVYLREGDPSRFYNTMEGHDLLWALQAHRINHMAIGLDVVRATDHEPKPRYNMRCGRCGALSWSDYLAQQAPVDGTPIDGKCQADWSLVSRARQCGGRLMVQSKSVYFVDPFHPEVRTAGEIYFNEGATRPLSVERLRELIASQHAFRAKQLARSKARWG